jgi:Putative beta-barrel porin-2, OmpL-like. bbp2
VGNEVVESNANWNYSRSILFYGIPLYHTGLSVGFTPSSQFAITGYVVDGWNNSFSNSGNGIFQLYDYLGEKTYGLQVKINPAGSKLGIVLNGIYGPDPYGYDDNTPTLVSEAILSYPISDKFAMCLDSQFGLQTPPGGGDSASYLGFALYGQLTMEQGWGAALRLEDVMNNGTDLLLTDGSTPSVQAQYQEVTLTLQNQMTPNVLARLEGRFDTQLLDGTAVDVYANNLASSQVTGTASMVFSF